MKRGDKSQMAAKAAVMLGEALDELDVPLEIIGFSTAQYEAHAAMALGLTPPHKYRNTRCSALEHRIYKSFAEAYSAVGRRMVHIQPRFNNWDEEHLLFALRRIQARRARRRVILVISDGQPNGDATHMIEAVRRAERHGVEVVGIGIGADYVRQIYRASIVVDDFKQLAQELVEVVSRPFRTPHMERAA
jgi:cobaltochelatase CobT